VASSDSDNAMNNSSKKLTEHGKYQPDGGGVGSEPPDAVLLTGTSTNQESRLATIVDACCQVRKPMFVGMLVIIGAYMPSLTLGGVEGRMFRPLAQSVILLLCSTLLLTITLVPALCAMGSRPSGLGFDGYLLAWLKWHQVHKTPKTHNAAGIAGAGELAIYQQIL
jgi:Cu/Ag efflux pump CusA